MQDTINADKAIATKILPATTFYKAEAYHQDFYKSNQKDMPKNNKTVKIIRKTQSSID